LRRLSNTAGIKLKSTEANGTNIVDKYNTNTRHARQADRRELSTRLSYALSAAASISSDALPVGNVPCGDAE